MKAKKLIALSVALFLCAGLLFAGGKAETEGDTTGAAEQAQSLGPVEMYKPDHNKTYEIEWLGSHSNSPVPQDAETVLYLEGKYNVDFNMWYVERSKWNEILNVRIAGGDFPDIVTVESPSIMAEYVNQGLITEVPIPVIEEYAPRIYNNIEKIGQDTGISPWVVTKLEGTNYGIPKFNENGKYHMTSVWRNDWLENVGIEKVPETLQEFEDAFYKFVENDPDQNGRDDTYGLSCGYRSRGNFTAIFGAFGYLPRYWELTDDDRIVYGAVQPEMKQALGLLAKWYNDGIINPEFITGENRGGHWSISHDFLESKIGYTNTPPYYHIAPPGVYTDIGGKFYRTIPRALGDPDEVLAYGRPPIGPNGESGDVKWDIIIKQMLVFNKDLEESPDKLGKLLYIVDDICADFENYVRVYFGEEGKHYEITDSGEYVVSLPEGTQPEDYGLGMPFIAWGGDLGINQRTSPKLIEFAETHANYTQGYTNKLYTSLPSYDLYWDEIDKLQRETYMQIITGEKDVDAFDDFVEQWMKRGGEQLTKEANDWYDSVK